MTFAETWQRIDGVDGWLTRGQAARLHQHAAALRPGDTIVEVGSYRGRSAIVLASAAPAGVRLVAIDPHAGNDRGPLQLDGAPEDGQADYEAFMANLDRAGVAGRVHHVRRRSIDALDAVDGPVQLLYIDGAHRYRPARNDIVHWGMRVPVGGTMLIHDSFNAVGLTLAQLRVLVFGGHFRFVGRERSLSEYRREELSATSIARNAVRQSLQLGYFARSLVVKGALALRQPRVARLLGHDGGPWPY